MTIRNKLITHTVSLILLSLLAVGFAFDLIITDIYNNKAQEELNHSYQNFEKQLKEIKKDILSQTVQISTENLPTISF